jgi:hypothetical protein
MANPKKRKSKVRQAKGRLNKFIQQHIAPVGHLPLVHINRAYTFVEMLGRDRLEPKQCDIFEERLIYFFYGRPAYRAKDGNNARFQFEWPIVFVFDPYKVAKIKRIFPFDTGAFSLGLYEQFFARESELSDFELDPAINSAGKAVGAFYRDHDEYYTGYSRKNVELPDFQFEAQGVQQLSQLPGVQDARSMHRIRDERSSAIEIQVNRPVRFTDALLAVVLPEPYLDNDEVKAALARWDVNEVETYPTLHNLGGKLG